MGNGAAFSVGRFDEYRTVKYIAGVRVVAKVDKTGKSNTPMHSHSANTMYAKYDTETRKIDQIAVYENHNKVKDIDIGHDHKPYTKTDIHVHDYVDGVRKKARDPTEQEKMILQEVRRQDNG